MNTRPKDPRCRISRRQFLETAGLAAAGLVAARCGTPAAVQTAQPSAEAQVAATKPVMLSNRVAISAAQNYDRSLIERTVRELLDNLGGLSDVVKSGDRVVIKTNLTGGVHQNLVNGMPAIETYITHPEVVRALGAAVRDAGAKELYIVDSSYEWDSWVQWGYEDIVKDIDAKLLDLNQTDPYADYAKTPVPGGSEYYSEFTFNHILEETDVFMSVSKMKCHWVAGVTHTMKNLVGLVPARFYRLTTQHSHRSAFHGPSDETAGTRIPRIIVALNKARPIHFGLVDGIMTTEAGEGPWINGIGPIAPGVLIGGKNPLATDAVATAVQGFDPDGASKSAPFVRGDNHLALAREAGLGTNRLDEIEVVGVSIDDVRMPFRPCYG